MCTKKQAGTRQEEAIAWIDPVDTDLIPLPDYLTFGFRCRAPIFIDSSPEQKAAGHSSSLLEVTIADM
jgi:hypothetical protein